MSSIYPSDIREPIREYIRSQRRLAIFEAAVKFWLEPTWLVMPSSERDQQAITKAEQWMAEIERREKAGVESTPSGTRG